MSEDSATDSAADGALVVPIEVSYEGSAVFVTVRPPPAGEAAVTLDQAVHELANSPTNQLNRESLARAVRNQAGSPTMVGEVAPARGLEENWFIAVSPNRMTAYVVPVPTKVTDDPDAPMIAPQVSASQIRKQLGEQGIVYGVLNDALSAFADRTELTSMVQVAQGLPAVEGQDARIDIVEAVLLATANHEPVKLEDGSVDHHATMAQQFVEEGTLIATRQPPIEGRDGEDIMGNPKTARAVRDQALESLVGENTEVRGEELLATGPGRPVQRGSKIDVLPVFVVDGDLDYSVGNVDFAGDVTVRGDVKPGFSIVATGAVTVSGMTEHARIRAGGDISLQGAVGMIEGDDDGDSVTHEAEIVSDGNLTANYLHGIAAEVLGEVMISREVVNCQLMANTVRTPSRGRIVGGLTVAKIEVETGTLGSQNGVSTHVQVHAKRSDGPGVLRALTEVHAGVKVNVSGAILDVEDELKSSSFWQLEGDVVRLDGMATVQDLIALAEATDRRPPELPDEPNEEPDTTEAAA
ncbi:MAG: DUF342 domain-containing protein [Dehalococcoidia bacterium]|jgi:uncharacterized protein (DUF342 family)|nr:DUF342 domain-containing protein [Dehalococcoidia bacterium]